MPLKLNRARYAEKEARAKAAQSGGGSIRKLSDGRTYLRLFPFEHEVTQADFDNMCYGPEDNATVGEVRLELEREIRVHFQPQGGAVNCSLQPDCPYCARSREFMQSASQADQQTGKRMGARTTYYFNAVATQENGKSVEPQMSVFSVPYAVFSEIMGYLSDVDYEDDELLGARARDFIIDRDSKATPDKMYAGRLRKEGAGDEIPEEIANQTRDLMEMEMLHPGWSSDNSLSLRNSEVFSTTAPAPTATIAEEVTAAPAPKKRKVAKKKEAAEAKAVEAGAKASFQDDDETIEGVGLSVEDGEAILQDEEGNEWSVDIEEISVL